MAQANPGSDQDENKDDSSECPSCGYSTDNDCEEPDPVARDRAEERLLQQMREAYSRAVEMRDRQPQPQPDDGHLEEDGDCA